MVIQAADEHEPRGNDGLTDAERADYAADYQHAVRPIDDDERVAIAKWREQRALYAEMAKDPEEIAFAAAQRGRRDRQGFLFMERFDPELIAEMYRKAI